MELSAQRENSVSVVNVYPINVNMLAVQTGPVVNLVTALTILVQALIVVRVVFAERANVSLAVLMSRAVLENAVKMEHASVIVVVD